MTALVKAAPARALPAKIKPQWLAEQEPHAVQKGLEASLEQRFGLKFGVRGCTERGTLPTLVVWTAPTKSQPDLAAALAYAESAAAPAPADVIERALAIVSVQTDHFAGTGERADLQLAVYVQQLQRYPADIALQALRGWPDKSRDWPQWFDLKKEMAFWAQFRADIVTALQWELQQRAALPPPAA